MKTANLAIVFTDIKGFTERTSRQTLEENQRLLKLHSDLLRPLFAAFNGKVIKSIGDAFLVTFESPTQAVLCGAAIQDRLWDHNRLAQEPERLEIRVAINVGEVRLEANDVFGEPVNIAARVEGLAEAGEVFFTEAVYLAMNKAEVPAQEVGAFELKGIPGKVRIFKVPRAPYRVAPAGIPPPTTGEQPPFGNLGMSRVQDDLRTQKFVNIGQAAASIGATASAVGGALVEKTRKAPQRMVMIGGAVVGALLIVLLVLLGRGTELDRRFDALEAAPKTEREQRIREIKKLIAEVKDPAEQTFYEGRLDEALGSPARAARTFGDAAKQGSAKAERRLIELIDHQDCHVREAAASVAGDIQLKRAKGALESLAANGGPGEDDTPLFGCSSKRAAEQALKEISSESP